MFHLLGNFFFGGRGSQTTVESNDIQGENNININQNLTEASTQTSNDISLLEVQQEQEREHIKDNEFNLNNSKVQRQQNGELDWVIVDKSEEADKCKLTNLADGRAATTAIAIDIGVNTSIIQEKECESTVEGIPTVMTLSEYYASCYYDKNQEQIEQNTNCSINIDNGAFLNQQQENNQHAADNDDDDDGMSEALLGSFFERNQIDDQEEENDMIASDDDDDDDADHNQLNEEQEQEEITKQQQQQQQQQYQQQIKKREDWLITPLPCLTSIHTSQRSIIENHPFENLLIEHPSMSVFVTATSSSLTSANLANNEMNVEEEEEEEEDNAIINDVIRCEQMLFKSEAAPVAATVANKTSITNSFVKQQQQEESLAKCKQQASQMAKRKCVSTQQVSPNAKPDSPKLRLRKKGKKNNKSSISPSNSSQSISSTGSVSNNLNNKENMQVKSLLMSKNLGKNGACSQSNKNDVGSLTSKRNQMNRLNKLTTFGSIKNVNNKQQRKYHKLQQPAFFSPNQQF